MSDLLTRDQFGDVLRSWRGRRNQSQLHLAGAAGVSQRHISFLENGGSRPSREMVIHLGLVLDMPLRDRNGMLIAAGFAPIYPERSIDDPELADIRRALDAMLAAHDPFPAYVIDRHWNMVMANPAAGHPIAAMPPAAHPHAGNMAKLVLHPDGLRTVAENWNDAAAATLLLRLERKPTSHPVTTSYLRYLEKFAPTPIYRMTESSRGYLACMSCCCRSRSALANSRFRSSPRLQRWPRRRTSRCRNFALRPFFLPTNKPRRRSTPCVTLAEVHQRSVFHWWRDSSLGRCSCRDRPDGIVWFDISQVEGVTVPGGFQTELWASGFDRPIQMVIGTGGDLVIADLNGGEDDALGRILRVASDDVNDRVVLQTGLDKPTASPLLVNCCGSWSANDSRYHARAMAPRDIVADDLPSNGRSEGTLTVTPDGLLVSNHETGRIIRITPT